ncbi:MAG: Calx-beta domain-containing protein [Pyrinomonadaceae bacterium]
MTLIDGQSRPFINVNDVRIAEGNTGTVDAQFRVSLSSASTETISVNYTTGDGTASSASDFTAASGTLTFPPLTTSALINVKVNGDSQIETDEAFTVNFSNPVNASISRFQAIGTILNDDAPGRFQFSSPTYRLSEDGGSALITVNRVNGITGTATINYATSNGTATAGSDYTDTSGTLTFAESEATKTFTVPIINDMTDEPDETVSLTLSGPTGGASLGNLSQSVLTINDNDDSSGLQFSQANYTVVEDGKEVIITVTRSGDTSNAATVNYATVDATASQQSDNVIALGTLRFAAGEASKTFSVLINDDTINGEGVEIINLSLSNPVGNALGTLSTATVMITDNDTDGNAVNMLDTVEGFVRQQYHDFLNRTPDEPGLRFWTGILQGYLDKCGTSDTFEVDTCRARAKASVSEAFFVSVEFQKTGYLIYRLYTAAFDPQSRERSLPKYREFIRDTQQIGSGVIVNAPGWEQKLEENTQAFLNEFVRRQEFLSRYPETLTAEQYVDALYANAGLTSTRTVQERELVLANYGQGGVDGRARALRAIAESNRLFLREFNRAFVLMQYFGYLRRNPNDPQDKDYSGYDFWLNKLDTESGDTTRFQTIDEVLEPTKRAQMVEAFVVTGEYRRRFGPE